MTRTSGVSLCDGAIDKEYWDKNRIVIGVDEAGRGPIAGPMFVGAVSFPRDGDVVGALGVKDSKKFSSEEKRFIVGDAVENTAVAFCVQVASVEEINEAERLTDVLWRCAVVAVNKVIAETKKKWHAGTNRAFPGVIVLVDGNEKIRGLNSSIEQVARPKLDVFSWNVAAASVLAKNAQVREMEELHKKHPGYYFNRHHGYGTDLHVKMIMEFGTCAAHRKWAKTVKIDAKRREKKARIRTGTATWADRQE